MSKTKAKGVSTEVKIAASVVWLDCCECRCRHYAIRFQVQAEGVLVVDDLLGHFFTYSEAFVNVALVVREYVDELDRDGRLGVLSMRTGAAREFAAAGLVS